MSESDERRAFEAEALEHFTEYFVRNYPGPTTIIHDPYWHAPKIFRAACYALEAARAAAPASEDHEGVVAVAKSRTEGAVTSGAHCDSPPLPTAGNQSCTPSPVAAPPADTSLADRLDWYADHAAPGSTMMSDLYVAATFARKVIDAAPVPPSAWVSVKDRLPECGTNVLFVCKRHGIVCYGYKGTNDPDSREWFDESNTNNDGEPHAEYDVTHWQDLPSAPQETEK